MTEKKTGSKPTNGAAKRKTAAAGTKAASPRVRIRKSAAIVSADELERKAYALWESRGRPVGSPEEDWYKAKEQLGI